MASIYSRRRSRSAYTARVFQARQEVVTHQSRIADLNSKIKEAEAAIKARTAELKKTYKKPVNPVSYHCTVCGTQNCLTGDAAFMGKDLRTCYRGNCSLPSGATKKYCRTCGIQFDKTEYLAWHLEYALAVIRQTNDRVDTLIRETYTAARTQSLPEFALVLMKYESQLPNELRKLQASNLYNTLRKCPTIEPYLAQRKKLARSSISEEDRIKTWRLCSLCPTCHQAPKEPRKATQPDFSEDPTLQELKQQVQKLKTDLKALKDHPPP